LDLPVSRMIALVPKLSLKISELALNVLHDPLRDQVLPDIMLARYGTDVEHTQEKIEHGIGRRSRGFPCFQPDLLSNTRHFTSVSPWRGAN
jgi:hypothetical protein